MNNIGKIISLNGNEALVSVIRQGTCGENCAACKTCVNKTVDVTVHCDFQVKPGDLVIVSSKSSYVYLGLLLVFIIPVLLPLFAYLSLFKFNHILSIAVAVLMFIASLILIFFFSKNQKFLTKLKPKVVSVINNY